MWNAFAVNVARRLAITVYCGIFNTKKKKKSKEESPPEFMKIHRNFEKKTLCRKTGPGWDDYIVGHEGGRETLSEGSENVFEWSQFWNIIGPRFQNKSMSGRKKC